MRTMSAAVATQAIGSLTNFIFSFYLLHTMVPREFGLFGIGLAVTMVLAGFWQGFFITQYIVLAPKEDTSGFPENVYTAMSLVSACTAIVVLVTAATLESFFGLGLVSLGIGFSAIAFSFKEFHIRYAFSTGRGKQAVLINSFMGLALAVFLTTHWLLVKKIDAGAALMVYACIVSVAAIGGHLILGLSLFRSSRIAHSETLGKLAEGGKWAIATNTISSLRNNAHVIVLASLLGPTAVAMVNAARLFLTPPILLVPALSNVILPNFARTFHKSGPSQLQRSIAKIGASLFAIAMMYAAALLLAWPYLEPVLVGDQYQELFLMVAAWCAYAAIIVIRSVLDWGAQAQRQFSFITRITLYATALALLAAWTLTILLGPTGSVVALFLTELVMAAALWTIVRRT